MDFLNHSKNTRRFVTFMSILYLVIALIGILYLVFDSAIFEKQRRDLINELEVLEKIIANIQLLSQKSQSSGYAPLGADGIIPEEFIPSFVQNIQFNSGCWNAQTNFPSIQDGIGTEGQTYIVCVPGNTMLDGRSKWFLFDFVVFSASLNQWIRIDLTRNLISDVSALEQDEVSLIEDGEGPLFAMSSIDTTSELAIIFDNDSKTYYFEFVGPRPDPTLQSNFILGAGSIIFSSGPGNASVKSITGSTTMDVEETSDSIKALLYPRQLSDYQKGVFNVSVVSTTISFIRSNTLVMGYLKIGRFIRISSISNDRVLGLLISELILPNTDRAIEFVMDFSTCTDPLIASLSYNIIQGQWLGFRTFEDFGFSGLCESGLTPTTVRCRGIFNGPIYDPVPVDSNNWVSSTLHIIAQ